MLSNRVYIIPYLLAALALFVLANEAMAMDASPAATGLPGEAPIQKIVRFIVGPVAWSLSIIGLVAFIGNQAFGAELQGISKGILLFVIVVGFLAFAVQVITMLFTGATVPDGGLQLPPVPWGTGK